MFNYYVVRVKVNKELEVISGFNNVLDAESYILELRAKRHYNYVIMTESEYASKIATDTHTLNEAINCFFENCPENVDCDFENSMNHNKVLDECDEDEIREILLYHKVVKVDAASNTLILDNGTELTFVGNKGCGGCNSGWYEVTELNECDNAITNVEFVCDAIAEDDYNDYDDGKSYKIFVYAEDRHIKLAQIDGDDGNGCYGTGYTLYVRFKN